MQSLDVVAVEVGRKMYLGGDKVREHGGNTKEAGAFRLLCVGLGAGGVG